MEEVKYTPKEEFMNAFTHSLGALFSIYAIVMLAVASKTPMQTATTTIFQHCLYFFNHLHCTMQWLMKPQKLSLEKLTTVRFLYYEHFESNKCLNCALLFY